VWLPTVWVPALRVRPVLVGRVFAAMRLRLVERRKADSLLRLGGEETRRLQASKGQNLMFGYEFTPEQREQLESFLDRLVAEKQKLDGVIEFLRSEVRLNVPFVEPSPFVISRANRRKNTRSEG
jgi:hypothetical protein